MAATPTNPAASLRRPRSLRTPLRSSTRPDARVLALSAAMLMPLAAFAQAKADEKGLPKETELPQVKVQAKAIDPNPNAQPGVPYKAATSGDARHTRPLAETPQTISVITKSVIEESGATDLKAILNAQPGITLGTGENGNQFGDRYIIRGQEARSDVFVDGLRDPGMTIRESFAIEQVEISKGPNSSFAGRGTAGGAVNAITKQATLDYDFARASTGIGTDKYTRVTADVNKAFGDKFVTRTNLLYGYEQVPDRAPADRTRKGLAIAGLYEFTSDLSLGVDFYGLRAKDKPDLGSYLEGTVPNRTPRGDVPSYTQDPDFVESSTRTVTGRLKWRITPDITLTDLIRKGADDNGYVTTGSRSATAYAGTGSGSPYITGVLDSHNGWQDVDYFANQTNLAINKPLFGHRNELIASLEYTDHKVRKGIFNVANAGALTCRTTATATVNNNYCTVGPDGGAINGIHTQMNRQITRGEWNADWHIKTWAASLMDTFDITEKFTAFGGVRFDRYDFDLGIRATTGVVSPYNAKDTLTNGHFGLTYKVLPDAIVYASFATAEDINGGESDVGTNSGYGGAVIFNNQIASAQPEKSRNKELGFKWDALDHKLLFTAAAFETRKTGVMEGADYDSFGTFNTGANRVRGFELGVVGKVAEQVTLMAGYASMKSRILASATPANVGRPLANFAEKSFFGQVKYTPFERFSIGATAKYESDKCAGQPDTAAGFTADGQCSQPIPGYTKYDAFATYRINKNLDLRLNVLNVTDRRYYTAGYRAGFFVYIGDARATRLTVNYEF